MFRLTSPMEEHSVEFDHQDELIFLKLNQHRVFYEDNIQSELLFHLGMLDF